MINQEAQGNNDEVRGEKISAFGRKADSFYKFDNKKVAEGLKRMNEFKPVMQQKLKPAGKRIEDFLFWHILIGSGPANYKSDLDTPDGDIEKLLDELIS
jgi:hypothetical protein